MLKRTVLKIDGEDIVCSSDIRDENAVILHGAGTSNREKYYPLAHELLVQGIGVVVFDFSGHGESSGHLSELSLRRRELQASGIIEAIVPKGQLYLLGFSMGAQTACGLLPVYGKRTKALLLGCPAMYTEKAVNIPFGKKKFTELIREQQSWENSSSPNKISGYTRRVVLAIGSEDEVIPKGVVNLLRRSSKHVTYIEYPGVGHQLAYWLQDNPEEQHKLIKNLIG